jgi:hypothetical protein
LTNTRLRITTPNGGNVITPGTSSVIQWNSAGIVGAQIKLKL